MREWIATPLYLSGAWALMISYQLFTQTALETVINFIKYYWPSVGIWLNFRLDVIVFVYSLTWAFVLSSALPSVVLGNKKSVLIQFFLVLILTLSALSIKDILVIYNINVDNILSLAVFFKNIYVAIIYLAAPYLLMIEIDLLRSDSKK